MKTLIVTDTQLDFLPGGSLAVPNGDEIIPVINNLFDKFELVIFTKDWHPADMNAFASSKKNKKPFDTYTVKGKKDTLWPDHCVQDTIGATLSPDLDLGKINGDFYIFKKGTTKKHHPYSGFDGTELNEFLQERKVTDVYVVGLALDFCCIETAIDAAFNGYKTTIILDGTKPINENIEETLLKAYDANINIKESWELNILGN